MAEGTLTDYIRKIVAKAEPYLPQVPKPKRKIPLQQKLLWCGTCVVIYMVMGQTPLFGATTPEFDFLAFARVIFASQQGSLVELGIGPIVTAGLLMQLLRGSDILKFDFKRPEERGIFQTATKMLTYYNTQDGLVVYVWTINCPSINSAFYDYHKIGQHLSSCLKYATFLRTFKIKLENIRTSK